jgi:hypothetical protein
MNKLIFLLIGIFLLSFVSSYNNFKQCYQETTNMSNGSSANCILNFGGLYYLNESLPQYSHMNYVKPPGANNSIWEVKHGYYWNTTIYNITIPTDCFNYSSSLLRLRFLSYQDGLGSTSQPQCLNGSWKDIGTYYHINSYPWGIGNLNTQGLFWDGNWSTWTMAYHSSGTDWYDNASDGGSVAFLSEEAIIWTVYDITNVSENNQSYSSPVGSGSQQSISLNISYYSSYYPSLSANLIYNGTSYSSTKTTNGDIAIFTSTFNSPTVTADTNYSFYWVVTLSNSSGYQTLWNSTNRTQLIGSQSLGSCGTNAYPLYNITLYDEDTLTQINGTSTNLTVYVGINISTGLFYNATYLKNSSIQICSRALFNSSTTSSLITLQYSSVGYASKIYNKFDYLGPTYSPVFSIYNLLSTRSQEFLIILQDTNYLQIPNAIIQVQRRYLGDNQWRIVDAPMTDPNGQTIAHFVLSSEVYNLLAYKNGVLLGTLINQYAVCQDTSTGSCTITFQLNPTSSSVYNVSQQQGLIYNFTFDETTRLLSVYYQTINTLPAYIVLNVTKEDAYMNTTYCNSAQNSSSGILTCQIPSNLGETSFIASLYKDGNFVAYYEDSIRTKSWQLLPGGFAIFLTIILILSTMFMFGSDPIIKLVGVLIGLIIAGLLMLIENGSIFSVSSSLMWLIISVGIGIYYLSRRPNG